MAKDQKFPSDANVKVDKGGNKLPKAKPQEKKFDVVHGKKVEVVEVHYNASNPLMLHNGVHQLVKGVNHIPKELLEESKKHPAFQHAIANKHVVIPSECEAEECDADDAKTEEGSASEAEEA